jgi:isoleucyl-tRNA synthetase
VHLCDYPVVDDSLIDKDLSAEMDALLRIVSLGSAARNSVKIKVRQPLASMTVRPANEAERKAVLRFADQIVEELNLKKVTADTNQLLQFEAKLNAKVLGPKLGPLLAASDAALKALPPESVWSKLQASQSVKLSLANGEQVVLEPSDILTVWKAPEGMAGVADGGTQILLDVRISEELELEGLARDVVRHVQELRKKSKLEPEDRIQLHLSSESPALAKALSAHKDYISAETLATEWMSVPLTDESFHTDAKIDNHLLKIQLRRSVLASQQAG